MPTLNVALVQTAPEWHHAKANLALFDAALHRVAPTVDLIVLPEMFNTGFTMCVKEVAETGDGPSAAWLRSRAADQGAVIVGSVATEDCGRYFNRCLWMPPDGSAVCYDKRHRFRMAGEHEHYAAGDARVVATLGHWRVRLAVCYDLRFPVWLRAREDYDVLLCVANWPAARQRAWNTLLRARAIENQCYVVGVNRVGVDGNGVAYQGGSAVYDCEGEAVVEVFDDDTVAEATLDLDALRDRRQRFPVWRDADDFEIRQAASRGPSRRCR